MKTKPYLLYFAMFIFILHTNFISTAGAANKIMPLGDSITQGTASGVTAEEFQVSYRKALYDRLKAAGYVVNDEIFVGTLISGESVANFDPDHEGHPGWRAEEIVAGRTGAGEGKLSDWLLAQAPNIVLLHIGTNDISGNNEDWKEVEDILVVIDDYESASGKAVWIILSLIIDRNCDPFLPPCPKSLETTNFNNDVRDFVFLPRQTGGDKIVLLDMQNDAGINYDRWDMGGDMWNGLHPFETGYDKMADLWFSGLMEILPKASAGLDQNVEEFDSVTLDASASTDPKNGTLSYLWIQTRGTTVVLSHPQAAHPNFVAPEVTSGSETLAFRVTVTDDDGLESTDTVNIEVLLKDNCPNDPNKIEPGICGCGIADTDSDGDGTLDCSDSCPDDPGKSQPGHCGCGLIDTDTDNDGTPDCNDNCPSNPGKIDPGICGCGIADIDIDGDGIFDCSDNCPDDPSKSQPGTCGCGVLDTDTDNDGSLDCADNCPNDTNKTDPGVCGCGVADVDTNGDDIFDCADTKGDNDGVSDIEEQGPDGNDPNYDGNDDGIADRLQNNVTSLHTYDDRNYVTIESPAGTSISNGRTVGNPAATTAPSGVSFSDGFFEFTIIGVKKGGAATVRLHFLVGTTFETYYKIGPTENNSQNHWYEFLYNGQTGAEINGHIITLHLIDGLSGDDDLMNNGIIVDVGGPGNFTAVDDFDSGTVGSDGSGGGGGGGCLISAAAHGFPGSSTPPGLILLLGSILISLPALKLQKKPEK